MLPQRSLNPFGLSFGKRPRYPNPQDSTGVLLASLGLNRSCWEAVGKARTDFNTLQEEIGNYIGKTCESVPSHVVWSLYMVGKTRETSYPIVTFISFQEEPRKRLRSLVKESKILEKYPGFSTMDIDRPPGCISGVMKTCGGQKEAEQDISAQQVSISVCSNSLMGSRIFLEGTSGMDQVATGGGLVQNKNKIFMVSVAHGFEKDWKDRFCQISPPGEYIFDIDEFSDDDEEGQMPSEMLLSANLLLESTVLPKDRYSQEHPNAQTSNQTSRRPKSLTFNLNGPTISSTKGGTSELDYSLFELTEANIQLLKSTTIEGGRQNHPKIIPREPRSTEMIVHTSSGPIPGRLLATPSFMQSADTDSPQQLWTMTVQAILEDGICGSWVTDLSGMEVFGQIVAGAPEDGFAYIVPFCEILDDINLNFGEGWELARLDEFPGRSHLTKPEPKYVNQMERNSHCSSNEKSVEWGLVNEDEYLQAPRPSRANKPAQSLSYLDVAALIVNKMIGIGIFTAPPVVLLLTRSKITSMVLFIAGYIYTLISMMFYLEYSPRLPKPGGQILKLSSPLIWGIYFFYFILLYGVATSSMQFSKAVLLSIHMDYEPNPQLLRFIAVLALSLLFLLQPFFTKLGLRLNQTLAYVKIGILVCLVVVGAITANYHYMLDWGDATSQNQTIPAVAYLAVLYSFSGWENATFISEEVKDHQTLKKGFISAVGVVGLLYILVNFVFLLAVPCIDDLDPNVLVYFTPQFFGGVSQASKIWAVLIAVSAMGNISSAFYTSARVKQAIDKQGIVPYSRIWSTSRASRWSMTQNRTVDTQYGGMILHWMFSVLLIAITSLTGNTEGSISFLASMIAYASGWIGSIIVILFFYLSHKSSVTHPVKLRHTTTFSKKPYLRLIPPKTIYQQVLGISYLTITIFVVVVTLRDVWNNGSTIKDLELSENQQRDYLTIRVNPYPFIEYNIPASRQVGGVKVITEDCTLL